MWTLFFVSSVQFHRPFGHLEETTLRHLICIALATITFATTSFAAEVKTFEPPQTVDGKAVVWKQPTPEANERLMTAKSALPVADIPWVEMGLDDQGAIYVWGYTDKLVGVWSETAVRRLIPGVRTPYRPLKAFAFLAIPIVDLDLDWVDNKGENASGAARIGRIKQAGNFAGRVIVYLFEYDVELRYDFDLTYPLPPDTGGPKG